MQESHLQETQPISASTPADVSVMDATNAVQHTKLGWQVRLDLEKACQQIALDDNMKDYEALEMLLDEALAARVSRKVEK